jgi:hypothetical protein
MNLSIISMDGKEKALETAEKASASMFDKEEKKADESKLLSFPILHGLGLLLLLCNVGCKM